MILEFKCNIEKKCINHIEVSSLCIIMYMRILRTSALKSVK